MDIENIIKNPFEQSQITKLQDWSLEELKKGSRVKAGKTNRVRERMRMRKQESDRAEIRRKIWEQKNNSRLTVRFWNWIKQLIEKI